MIQRVFSVWSALRSQSQRCLELEDHLVQTAIRNPGGGNGNPLQHSCLENPMEKGAWQATVHGVAKYWTWQSNWACEHTHHNTSAENLIYRPKVVTQPQLRAEASFPIFLFTNLFMQMWAFLIVDSTILRNMEISFTKFFLLTSMVMPCDLLMLTLWILHWFFNITSPLGPRQAQ